MFLTAPMVMAKLALDVFAGLVKYIIGILAPTSAIIVLIIILI